MKWKIQKLVIKAMGCAASIALFIAMNSVTNTCCFLSYQPDVPTELFKI